MGFKCKVIVIVVLLLLIVGLMAALAFSRYLAYEGGDAELSSMDVRILEGGMSSVWCEGQTIKSKDGVAFNASVVPGTPHVNPNLRVRSHMKLDHVPLTPDKSRAYWRFYLLKGSIIDVAQCAGSTEVMSYIFEGEEIDDGCVNVFLEKDFESKAAFRNPLPPLHKFAPNHVCTNITLQRFIVRICRKAMQMMHAVIANNDFYIVLYQSSYPEDTYITAEISLDQPTFDLSNSIANCTSQDECTLPLQFNSDDTVVAKLLVDISAGGSELKWSCQPRLMVYLIAFVGGPAILIILISIFVCVCYRSKNHGQVREERVENRPPILEPPEVECEKQPLLTDNKYKSYESSGNVDPRLARMGPIPGPIYPSPHATEPTAPPEPQGEEGEVQPFREPTLQQGSIEPEYQPIYPEPPPTYEESMRAEEQEGDHGTRQPEKC